MRALCSPLEQSGQAQPTQAQLEQEKSKSCPIQTTSLGHLVAGGTGVTVNFGSWSGNSLLGAGFGV